MYPDKVRQRRGAPAFQVEGFLVLTVFFQHKGAEETQGRCAVQGISGQEREEALTSSGLFHNQGFQLLEIGRAHGLNSSHVRISYAVFCLKKKTTVRLC